MKPWLSAYTALIFRIMRLGKFMTLLSLAGLIAACGQTEPSRFYTLADLSGTAANSPKSDALVVGLGPVILPGYLDRPQIVVRQSSYRLETAEFDRWAEPLKDTVPRILAENLSFLLESDEVYLVPQRVSHALDLVVSVEFLGFEATLEGGVVLVARWEIIEPEDLHRLNGGRIVIERSGAPSEDYEALVELLSEALGELAQKLVEEVSAVRS